ncbi:MAG: ribonuclease Y [Chloroflexi bacterium]|nr:ribonuclease Y [Chloroflexota bacterium]
MNIVLPLSVLAALGVGVGASLLLQWYRTKKGLSQAKAEAERILGEAREKAKSQLLDAKEEGLRLRSSAEAELRERRSEVQRQERRLQGREAGLDRRVESLERREKEIGTKERELEVVQAESRELREKELKELERIAGLTQNEAKESILRKAEVEIQHELARRYRDMLQQAKDEADQKARKIIALAIQRLAADVVSETTTSVVPLPNDEMKGRLIGREGRNIRAIEQATGVDLIIDDTPEAVTVSCFDPVRREIAKIALQKLITDGRIHPARVEDMVEKARAEVEENIRQAGEKAVFDAGVQGLHPELVKLLGRLKYRYSYGENVLNHCVEVSLLSGMMASEIGADLVVTKTSGLLHDIGKALSHEVEGPHAEIGGDIAAKYAIPDKIRQAIMEHHDDEAGSVEAFLVAAADAISAARPGVRKDTLEHYVKRLEALEAAANAFPGIEKCYAIQAGREVRVMVKPDEVDDTLAAKMARDIAKKIEESVVYPGQIKVIVVRETRAVEFAK